MNPPMTYFRNYPEPFYPDWRSEPHPGWGVKPVMAGPARVGVGAITFSPAQKEQFRQHLFTECANFYAATPARQQQLRSICPRLGAPIGTEPPWQESPTKGEPPGCWSARAWPRWQVSAQWPSTWA